MKNIFKKLKLFVHYISKTNLLFFYITIFLIRLPPVYLLPTQNALFTSHSIARYLILFIFILQAITLNNKSLKKYIPKSAGLLILFYFFTQSISVIHTRYIEDYWLDYKNVIFSIMVFYIAVTRLKKQNIIMIIWIFIITGVINLMFEFVTYFKPEFVYAYLQPLFYNKYWESLNFQIQRQRYFPEIFDEILIPFLFYTAYIQRNTTKKIMSISLVLGIAVFSLISNWRIRLVMLIFSLLISFRIYITLSKKFVLSLMGLLPIFLILGYIVSVNFVGFNALDRLISPSKTDIGNILTRFTYFNEALDISLSSPVVGIGLGQYEDYSSAISSIPFNNSDYNVSISSLQEAYYPHNIFFNTLATSGTLGLISLIFLIFFFIKSDLNDFKKRSPMYKSFLIAFWTLFFLANTTPTNYFSYLIAFWLLRGIIQRVKFIEYNENIADK